MLNTSTIISKDEEHRGCEQHEGGCSEVLDAFRFFYKHESITSLNTSTIVSKDKEYRGRKQRGWVLRSFRCVQIFL